VLLVRVPYTTLVARLRPSTDLDSMNFLASHLLRADHLVQPEDEDTRRVHIRKHGCVPWVLLIDMGQTIQMRLVVGVDTVIADRGG
jgi:hypothetical protein